MENPQDILEIVNSLFINMHADIPPREKLTRNKLRPLFSKKTDEAFRKCVITLKTLQFQNYFHFIRKCLILVSFKYLIPISDNVIYSR